MTMKKVRKDVQLQPATDELPVSTQAFRFTKVNVDRTLKALAQVSGRDRINVFDLDQLRVPRGGTVWKTSEWSKPHVDGVIIHHHPARTYWARAYDGQSSSPPDCFSPDGIQGYGNPGGSCQRCPLARFGTDNERPPCRSTYRVYIVTPESVLPTHLSVPATSISSVRSYLGRLARTYGYFSYQVMTRFSLEESEQAPIIQCKELASLPEEMVEKLAEYAGKLRDSVYQPEPQLTQASVLAPPDALAGPTAPVPLFSEVDDEDDIPDVALPKE